MNKKHPGVFLRGKVDWIKYSRNGRRAVRIDHRMASQQRDSSSAAPGGLAAGAVRLDPGTTKDKEGRVFPMTRELRELLMGQKAKSEALQREQGSLSPWLFTYGGKRFKSFRRAWDTACMAVSSVTTS